MELYYGSALNIVIFGQKLEIKVLNPPFWLYILDLFYSVYSLYIIQYYN